MTQKEQHDRYFDLLTQAREAARSHDLGLELTCYRESIPFLRALVDETRRQYGRFDLSSIPVLENGVDMLAETGDIESLTVIRELIHEKRSLNPWLQRVKDAIKQVEDVGYWQRMPLRAIVSIVRQNPGILQDDLAEQVNTEAAFVPAASICEILARYDIIRREPAGTSFALSIGKAAPVATTRLAEQVAPTLHGTTTLPPTSPTVMSTSAKQGSGCLMPVLLLLSTCLALSAIR